MSVEIDMSEVRTLARDMSRVDGRLARHLIPVIRKGAVNLKTRMASDFRESGNAGFRAIGNTVSFDVIDSGYGVEVGPEKPRGALANIAYFGGANGGGGSVRDPLERLEEETSAFIRELDKVAEELVLGD